MSETILDKIVATKRQEIAVAKARLPEDRLRERASDVASTNNFFEAVSEEGPIRLIAEVKKASPSKGIIREPFDPTGIAQLYQQHGATCLSVLTDEEYFQGSLSYLRDIRQVSSIPILRKDFVLDTYQLLEAKCAGADAVLLIAECLDDCNLRKLHGECLELGMTPLVEFYLESNLPRVLDAGATLIGVNNRDLRSFEVDLEHSIRMRERIPDDCVVVGESGISSRNDVLRLQDAGIDAILVGEYFMRQADVATAVVELMGG